MPQLAYSNLVSQKANELNSIPDSTWGNSMRVSIENKNLLSGVGYLYVGTGIKNTVVDGEGNDQDICQTAGLELGDFGTVLTSKKGNAQYPLGVAWEKVSINSTIISLNGADYSTSNPTGWQTATGANPAGTYMCQILPTQHGVGVMSNIMVQIMIPNGTGNWSIVSTTIDITDGGVVTIYSNIKTQAKVLLVGLGG